MPKNEISILEGRITTLDQKPYAKQFTSEAKGYVAQANRVGRDDDWIIGSARGMASETLKAQKDKARSKHHKKSCFDYDFGDDFKGLKS